MDDTELKLDAMTIVIAALHQTITQGMFQSITFTKAELADVVGSKVELSPTAEGGVSVIYHPAPTQGEGHESVSEGESPAS